MEIAKLVEELHRGGHTLVVYNRGEMRCFGQRGVLDIYELSVSEPEFLRGAMVADKVVGVGAAVIMILSGVAQLYTDVISEGALKWFSRCEAKVGYQQRVEYIINRQADGMCPLESRCQGLSTLTEIKLQVDRFIQELSPKRKEIK